MENEGWEKPPMEYEVWLDEMMSHVKAEDKDKFRTFALFLATVDRKLYGYEQRFLADFIKRPKLTYKTNARKVRSNNKIFRNACIRMQYEKLTRDFKEGEPVVRVLEELADQYDDIEDVETIRRIVNAPTA